MTEPQGVEEAEVREALLAALAMQVEAGIDEAISEEPTDWRAAFQPAARPDARPGSPAPRTEAGPARPAERGGRPGGTAAPGEEIDEQRLALDSARAAAAAAADLAALHAALAGFEGSALKVGATNCVFSDGDPCARVMVIGEAPGREEDQQGKPFVGRSGRLLDAMLQAIGLDRRAAEPEKAAYIANVVPFRPLQNRTPDDAEVALLMPFLERHIALAAPDFLLCIGNVPAKHVMGAERGITRYRGTWKDVAIAGRTIPALATFHPAYLLRSPEMKRHAWRDLLSLEARLRGGS